MSQTTRHYPLGGGLDLVTPAIAMPAGKAVGCLNYEATSNGYRRMDGYERFDGRTRPSKAGYWLLAYADGVALFSEGDVVEGATSGASGIVLDVVGNIAAGAIVLAEVAGTFVDGEDLEVASVLRAVASGTANLSGADNDADDSAWRQAAIELARSNIAAVPGSGPVRGVWLYRGDVYAFRDDPGGTAGEMWKATAAGWASVPLGIRVPFTSGGTHEPAEGDTITGATSTATLVIGRIVVKSGTWSGGDAAGYIVATGTTGTFTNGENANIGGETDVLTLGPVTANTLAPGGRYEFTNHNFYARADWDRMYGVSGVGPAFEFDGTVFAPILTDNADDKPFLIAEHRNHLFLGFAGGSVQHSATGDPMDFRVITGGAEIGFGQELTGFIPDYAGVLVILGRNKVALLSGNDPSDWVLDPFANDAGAMPWTAQKVGRALYVDDSGVRDMATTQRFGDFTVGTVTELIKPLLDVKKEAGIFPVASLRVRGKDQYRLFYSDLTGITIYLGKRSPEPMRFELPVAVRCCVSGEDANGIEMLFIGSDDGWVYQLDAGNSFDGAPLPHFVRLAWNHCGSPTQEKRYHKATLELDSGPDTELGIVAEFAYADPEQTPGATVDVSIAGGGGFWDEMIWDQFYWSSPAKGVARAPLDGAGENISVTVAGQATYTAPHTLHGLTLHISFRRLVR